MRKDDGFDDPAPGEETVEAPPDEGGGVDEAAVSEAAEPQRPATAAESEAAGFGAAPDAPTASKSATATVQELHPTASIGQAAPARQAPASIGATASSQAEAIDREIPDDLVESGGAKRGPASAELRDAAAVEREKRIPDSLLRKEETVQNAWRQLLTDLKTTRLVHVKLMKRGPGGSFVNCGERPNVDVNEVRSPGQLVPYGTGSSDIPQKWIIKVASGSARVDDDSAYRDFVYERIGPAAPPGWALDSALAMADEAMPEGDMNTYREYAQAVLNEIRSNPAGLGIAGMPGMPGAAPPQQPPPWPGYPPPYPYPPYGMPGMMPFGMTRGDDSERQDRERRDREDRERREREDRDRRETQEREERREKERKEDREKAEAAQKAADERHRQDAEATRQVLDQMRAESARREADHREQIAKLERDRAEADHRAQIGSVTSTLDALKSQIADLKDGGAKKGNSDWLVLAGTVAPMVNSYLANQQSSAADERRFRIDEANRERERMMADSERMNRLFSSLGESHTSAAKMAADLIQRMQDPSAIMNMTRLVSETLGGNIQLISQMARSGLIGGKGGSDIPWGDLMGRGLELGGNFLASMADQKARQMEAMASMPMMPQQQPAFAGVQGPQQMPPAQQPQMLPPTQGQQGQQDLQRAAVARRAPIVKAMADEINQAIKSEAPPAEVAGLIDSMVYAVRQFGIEDLDPNSRETVRRLREDPEKELLRMYPRANPAYIHAVAEALMAKSRRPLAPVIPMTRPTPQPQAPGPLVPPIQIPQQAAPLATPPASQAPEPPQAPPAAHAAQPPAAPAQAPMPAKRGRGRPRHDAQPPAAQAPIPPAAQPPAAPPAAPQA